MSNLAGRQADSWTVQAQTCAQDNHRPLLDQGLTVAAAVNIKANIGRAHLHKNRTTGMEERA